MTFYYQEKLDENEMLLIKKLFLTIYFFNTKIEHLLCDKNAKGRAGPSAGDSVVDKREKIE